MLIGQDKLIQKIDKFTLDTLPRTILLEGLKGSGRHTLINYISNKLNMTVQDISIDLTLETIEEINTRVHPYVYIIDTIYLSEKNENKILKFLEEPLKNAYIFLICENKYNLIDTIRNRCNILSMEKYSKDILNTILNQDNQYKDLILQIAETPGDVKELQQHDINRMITLSDKILDKIGVASLPNTLTLTNNIAFKNEKDKLDINLFFRLLLFSARNRVLNNYEKSIITYNVTKDYYNRTFIKNIDKKYLFENYLINLKLRIMEG